MYIHTLHINKEKFDSVKPGLNVQIIRFKDKLPKEGDTIVHQHEGEQKQSTITEISSHEGLMKNYYLVQHEMK